MTGKVWSSSIFFRRECKTAFKVSIRKLSPKLLFFWEIYKFLSISELEWTFFEICQKLIDEFVKTSLYVSISLFWGKRSSFEKFSVSLSFSGFEQKIFGHLLGTFWRSSQDCLLSVGTNKWTKNDVCEKFITGITFSDFERI